MLRSHTVRRAAIAVAATVAVAGVLAAASLGALASATHTLTGTVVSTALSSSSVAVGGAGVHDTATLSGLTGSTFTGDTVTYTVYPSESSCTSGSGGTSEGSVTVSGNGPAAPSNAFAPTSTGTYYWQATFNGADKTNAAASSDCSSEPLTVDGVTTALSSSSATVGGAGRSRHRDAVRADRLDVHRRHGHLHRLPVRERAAPAAAAEPQRVRSPFPVTAQPPPPTPSLRQAPAPTTGRPPSTAPTRPTPPPTATARARP